jgi:hypothetical protein
MPARPERDDPPVYAPRGSPDFNARLHAILQQLASDVTNLGRQDVVALILGGGYGRGEGGVWKVAGQECPYNDLDLVIVQTHRRPLPGLEAVRRKYHELLRIDVDFSRPLTTADVRGWEHRLMWHDLVNGHRVLSGPADLLDRLAPQEIRTPVPLVEASRLLLNRGAGLLWADRIERGVEPAPDAEFVRRNIQKAILALGDALLIEARTFTTACVPRLANLAKCAVSPVKPRLLALYGRALEFKLSPDLGPDEKVPDPETAEAVALWGETFLFVERRRLARPFETLQDYVCWDGIREPGEHALTKLPRNLWVNAKAGRLAARYPREDLYRILPQVLGLTHPPADRDALGARFLSLWQRFN